LEGERSAREVGFHPLGVNLSRFGNALKILPDFAY